MHRFITRHAKKITGVLSGFDRIVFRGTLRNLCFPEGVKSALDRQGVLLKSFGSFVQTVTGMLRDEVAATVAELGIPTRYLDSSHVRKENVAQEFLRQHPIQTGPICVLSAVEPCRTWQVFRSRANKTQELRWRSGKCLHHYHYFVHPEFGFMHVRVQTWMPYTVQVCINGREWLGRQLDRSRLRYRRADNCFPYLADPKRAQSIMDGFVRLPWTGVLSELAEQANPALAAIADSAATGFYWTVHQSEWATDVMFRSPDDLAELYPALVQHAMANMQSPDVLRFLGRKLSANYTGEVTTDYKRRTEGVRVKHAAGPNSEKMYDKHGLLRVENTMNKPGDFKVRRKAQGDPDSEVKLRPLRKSVVDLARRGRIGQAANKRYLDSLAVVSDDTPLEKVLLPLARHATLGKQRLRGLRPLTADLDLLSAVGRGEFIAGGFRNRDILAILFPDQVADSDDRRRASAKVTRLLRLLRAHGVIEKLEGTHRYVVTSSGNRAIAAIRAARHTPLSRLQQSA